MRWNFNRNRTDPDRSRSNYYSFGRNATKIMKTEHTNIPRFTCWKCGYQMEATTPTHEKGATPQKGDVSMCFNCGTLGIFEKDLTVRKPSQSELLEIDSIPDVMEAQIVRSFKVNKDLVKEQQQQRGNTTCQ